MATSELQLEERAHALTLPGWPDFLSFSRPLEALDCRDVLLCISHQFPRI